MPTLKENWGDGSLPKGKKRSLYGEMKGGGGGGGGGGAFSVIFLRKER